MASRRQVPGSEIAYDPDSGSFGEGGGASNLKGGAAHLSLGRFVPESMAMGSQSGHGVGRDPCGLQEVQGRDSESLPNPGVEESHFPGIAPLVPVTDATAPLAKVITVALMSSTV